MAAEAVVDLEHDEAHSDSVDHLSDTRRGLAMKPPKVCPSLPIEMAPVEKECPPG